MLCRRVQKSSGGGFLVCWGVDGAALPANFSKKGFFDEQNMWDGSTDMSCAENLQSIIVRCVSL